MGTRNEKIAFSRRVREGRSVEKEVVRSPVHYTSCFGRECENGEERGRRGWLFRSAKKFAKFYARGDIYLLEFHAWHFADDSRRATPRYAANKIEAAYSYASFA